jgi:hypothetical protein
MAPLAPLGAHTNGLLVVKLTAKPEEAVALTVTGDWGRVLLASGPKVIVWFTFVEANATGAPTPMVPNRLATRAQTSTRGRPERLAR